MSDAPKPLQAGWKSAILVCKACEKRGSGPKKVGAREVGKALQRAARDAGVPRARVVLTSCLSACPKKAFTVAAAAPGGSIGMIAFRRGDDAGEAIASLFPAVPATP